MLIGSLELTFHIPWANSLKDKRMTVKSLCQKLHNKFNVAAAEVGEQDVHRTAVIGVTCVSGDTAQLDSIMDTLLCWIEGHCEEELVKIVREIW